jgi:hypothetical protein
MTWNCHCELCRRAFQQNLEPRRWTDLLRHRDDAVIRADSNDGVPVYLTELDNEIVAITDDMEDYETLEETWREEVILIDFLRSCQVEPVEQRRNPFENVLRKKATPAV